MPTCRRKRVVLTEPSPALLEAFKKDPSRDVFYLERTGELFETYDAYAARMSFYRQKQFQCEVTGKSGLNYFEALDSEELEARTMHSRFPEPLKAPILKAVQWQVIGRLDHLIEAVYDRFKDRYFLDERVFVDIQGERYYARVMQVFPPRSSTSPSTVSPFPSKPEEEDQIHKLASDLKLPVKDANLRDDPQKYLYKIQIHEDNKEKAPITSPNDKAEAEKSKWSGSLMEVQCSSMSRDRLTFSKSILRRFIRDCVGRDAAVASPWVVKKFIADKYGVGSVMPDETRKGVENLKKGEMEKRKKAWEEKEGPSTKKQKKEPEQKLKEPAKPPPPPPEKKKKKPLRYPAEDLDVVLPERDKKAGAKVQRPIPSKDLPFKEEKPEVFERFLMVWNYLNVYGVPLHLSTFTLDEFEAALRHNTNDPPCTMIAEIHSTLIYNLRTVPFARQSASTSILNRWCPRYHVFAKTLTEAMSEVGNNWERVPLRAAEGREGWEEALVGCLTDLASLETFPLCQEVLTYLLFEVSGEAEEHSTPRNLPSEERANPSERYWTMPVGYKIDLLFFMCGLSVSSKAIHLHMESCEEQLTALRKEKIEINRSKKQAMESIAHLTEGQKKEGQKEGQKKDAKEPPNGSASTANGNGNLADQDAEMQDSSDLSDGGLDSGATSEAGSVTGSSTRRTVSRGQSLRRKAQAKSRELSRSNAASTRKAAADLRKFEEEVNKVDRRLEAIEREFRKLLGCIRAKPMGKDRFHNRIWWYDGLGSGTLVASGGGTVWSTGRVFIQGPSELDQELLNKREAEDGDVKKRRLEEEGTEGMLGVNEWAAYSDPEQVEEFVAWLNTKGIRENALKNNMVKWMPHIIPGIRKRVTDINAPQKVPEARRSARTKGTQESNREPYMSWTNRKATNNTS